MDVNHLTMPRSEARKQFELYRELLKKKHDETDEELCRAYEAMAEGTDLIDLESTLKEVGVDENYMPKLAIIPANAHWCWWSGNGRGGGVFHTERLRVGDGIPTAAAKRVTIPDKVFAPKPHRYNGGMTTYHETNGKALVPTVPAQYRPKRGLSSYHILFEAEWEPVPPVDPILLKRLGGPGSNLYAVIAQWDLSPLEQSVLKRRLVQ